jgi:hypothetical protein
MNAAKSTALLAILAGTLTAQKAVGKDSGSRHDRDPKFGIAMRTGTHICLSIRGTDLSVGSVLTLITPMNIQSVVPAEVAGVSQKPCAGIRNEIPSYRNYDLRITSGSVDENTPLIASTLPLRAFRVSHSLVSQKVAGRAGSNTFRACASQDGVHLTVWRGVPLKGARLWHEYYYLGQDLEPNCTGKDIAP